MAAWAGMCVKQADDLRKNGHYKQNVILKSVKWEHAMASWGVQESEGKALTGGTEVHVRGGSMQWTLKCFL